MGLLTALLLALSAILANTPATGARDYPDPSFVRGLAWAAPVSRDGFSGMAWVCDPSQAGDYGTVQADGTRDYSALTAADVATLQALAVSPDNDIAEVCYAGYDLSDVSDPTSPLVPDVGP